MDLEEQLLQSLEKSDDEGFDSERSQSGEFSTTPGGGSLDNLPGALLEGDAPVSWVSEGNLDVFFSRLYLYWESKGFRHFLAGRVLNLLALAFTGGLSGFLLLGVNYSGLKDPCLRDGSCSVLQACLVERSRVLFPITMWKVVSTLYLGAFVAYVALAVVHLVSEYKGMCHIYDFVRNDLGYSERGIRAATWQEVLARTVEAQKRVRICLSRDLTEQDIVMCIMRKDNYLIGMLNKGVLALSFSGIPGLSKAPLLTKTIEWNLRWCILNAMFDESLRVKEAFLSSPETIVRRFRAAAVVNIVLSPFLLVVLILQTVLKNAESVYRQPGSIGAREWSPLALWYLREFNEVPFFLYNRLNSGHASAVKYIKQFPNLLISHISRFVCYVAGSFAGLLIALTVFEDDLLEMDFMRGKQTVWWLALVGVVLAVFRPLVVDKSTASFDPELALLELAAHTHHYPRHWSGKAHTLNVQEEIEAMFRYRAAIFLEELVSVILTPIFLWQVLPSSANEVVAFLQSNTTHVSGVGDVCSFSAFDVSKHGNRKYGSSRNGPKSLRSKQGKMEKSIMSFAAIYPSWKPPEQSQVLLSNVESVFQDEHEILPALMDQRADGAWPNMQVDANSDIWKFLITYYPHVAKMVIHSQDNRVTSLCDLRNDTAKGDPGKKTMISYSMLQYFHDHQEKMHASLQSQEATNSKDNAPSNDQERSNEMSVLR